MTGESARSLDVWRLRIERRRQDAVLVLELRGRIGGASAGELATELEQLIGQGEKRLVLDLEKVDYISSSGLLALDAAGSRLTASRGCLVLCGINDAVRIALDLANLAAPLLIEQNLRSAVQAASALWPTQS